MTVIKSYEDIYFAVKTMSCTKVKGIKYILCPYFDDMKSRNYCRSIRSVSYFILSSSSWRYKK